MFFTDEYIVKDAPVREGRNGAEKETITDGELGIGADFASAGARHHGPAPLPSPLWEEEDRGTASGGDPRGPSGFRPDVIVVDGINGGFRRGDRSFMDEVYPPYAVKPPDEDFREMIMYTQNKLQRKLEINDVPFMSFLNMVAALTATDHTRYLDQRPAHAPMSLGKTPPIQRAGYVDMFGPTRAPQPSHSAYALFAMPPPDPPLKKRKLDRVDGPSAAAVTGPGLAHDQPSPAHRVPRYANRWINDMMEIEEARGVFGEGVEDRIESFARREGKAQLEGWLAKPEVTGVLQLKDSLIGALDLSFDQVVSRNKHLRNVPMKHFVEDPMAAPKFAAVVSANLMMGGCMKGNRTVFQNNIKWIYGMGEMALVQFESMVFDARGKRFESKHSPRGTTGPLSGSFRRPSGVGFYM